MIDRVRLNLHFPGDGNPVDVSHLVIDRSVSVDGQFCSDEYRSAVDSFSVTLKHDAAVAAKLHAAHDRIILRALDYESGAPVFYGAVEPTASQSIGEFVGNIELAAVDNSWKFDEPISASFTAPAAIGMGGFYLYNSDEPAVSLFHFLATMAGYAAGEIKTDIFPDIVPYCAVTAGEETYREFLDDLLFEYGYVFHADPAGMLYIGPWRHDGEAYEEELGPADLSVVTPVSWNKTAEYRDGAKVIWSEPSIVDHALVYRDNLSVSSDGEFEGKAIAAGDYYPPDSDIEAIYQDFVQTWLDVPYLTRATRLENKDLALITTSGQVVSFKADPGVVLELQEFESLRARVRFRNAGSSTAKIYAFEIHAKALLRLALHNVLAPDGATNPREYTSRFLLDLPPAVNLAKSLAIGVAFADYKYAFGLNRALPIGTVVRLRESRAGIDTLAMIQRCVQNQGAPVVQLTAIAITSPSGITYRTWASSVTSGWLASEATRTQLENVAGPVGEAPANVANLKAVAGKESIVVFWNPVMGTTVRTAAVGYILERSSDAGASWYDTAGNLDDGVIVPARVTDNPFVWTFNRATDGYPEATTAESYGYPGLDAYRFRVKGVNSSGAMSLNWTTLEMVDTSGYGTWLPAAPTGGVGSSADRNVKADWADLMVYGLLRYEVQVALQSADPTWYKPALGLDAMASEDNFRQSIVVGEKRHVSISQFTHTVPLAGQNDDPPNPVDTAYIYRVRSVSDRDWTGAEPVGYEEAEGGKTAGPWSATIPVLARATGAWDIVQHAIGRAQLALESIYAEHMSSQNLAAVCAYLAAISGGVDDEDNTWILNDYPGRTKAIGYLRAGGASADFIKLDPAAGRVDLDVSNGKVRIGSATNYFLFDSDLGEMALRLVSFKVSATVTRLKGTLSISDLGDVDTGLTKPLTLSANGLGTAYIGVDGDPDVLQLSSALATVNGALSVSGSISAGIISCYYLQATVVTGSPAIRMHDDSGHQYDWYLDPGGFSLYHRAGGPAATVIYVEHSTNRVSIATNDPAGHTLRVNGTVRIDSQLGVGGFDASYALYVNGGARITTGMTINESLTIGTHISIGRHLHFSSYNLGAAATSGDLWYYDGHLYFRIPGTTVTLA